MGWDFPSQGVIDNFDRRLYVDEFGTFDKKVLSPADAPLASGNFILGYIDPQRIAISMAFPLNDLTSARKKPVDKNLGRVGMWGLIDDRDRAGASCGGIATYYKFLDSREEQKSRRKGDTKV